MEFKKQFTIFFSSILIFFCLSELCLGLDEEGCLFCHQYPGMVRLEPSGKDPGEVSGKLQILHIDEQEFYSSAHGEVSCKKCHTTINSVPHTGESQVNCTTSCHKEDEEKEMAEDYPLNGFHEQEQSYLVSLDDKSSCAVCHPLYPHSENKVVRAFLNMHTGFIRCEVCHIKKTKFQDIVYDWEETQNAQFYGEPFGTYYNPRTKRTHKNHHLLSRITVDVFENGKKINLTDTIDFAKAKAFIPKAKTMTSNTSTRELQFFHRGIEKKEISVACNQCHSANSIMNFSELGFDEKKAKNLATINLKGLVTKYKTFYFPSLFE